MGDINMQVEVDEVNELEKGWKVRLNVNLTPEEFSRIDSDSINEVEDFNIFIGDSSLYFDCLVNTCEPWEDEPLEELLKALKFEVEYHVQSLLK
jgi:hypothetical protein